MGSHKLTEDSYVLFVAAGALGVVLPVFLKRQSLFMTIAGRDSLQSILKRIFPKEALEGV